MTTTSTTTVQLDPVTGQVVTTPRACCAGKTGGAARAAAFPLQTVAWVAAGASLAAVAYHAYRYFYASSSSSSCCAWKKASAPTASSTPSCCGGAAAVEDADAEAEQSHPYPVLTIEDETQFDAILSNVETNIDQPRKVFVLIEGSVDPVTGKSWCPDCVQAAPIIAQVLEENKDSVMLVEAPVRREKYKGQAQHPYRVHPELKLSAVPTLVRWEHGKVKAQLVEGELFDIDRVRDLIAN